MRNACARVLVCRVNMQQAITSPGYNRVLACVLHAPCQAVCGRVCVCVCVCARMICVDVCRATGPAPAGQAVQLGSATLYPGTTEAQLMKAVAVTPVVVSPSWHIHTHTDTHTQGSAHEGSGCDTSCGESTHRLIRTCGP